MKLPKTLEFILLLILPESDYMYLLGDYEEIYRVLCAEKGKYRANLWLITQIIKSLPIYLIDSFFWSTIMFKNYAKTTYRNLFRNKTSGAISIFSLSVAIGCAISIFAVLDLVFYYDAFHKNLDEIYIVHSVVDNNGETELWGKSPSPLAPAINAEFPQIKSSTRNDYRRGTIKYGDKVFYEYIDFVDTDFLEMFTFPLISGEKTSLNMKNSIILTEDIAIKYFGDEDPIGKTVEIEITNENRASFIVGGVAENISLISSLKFGALLPYENLETLTGIDLNSWKEKTSATFVQLETPSEANELSDMMTHYADIQNSEDPDWKLQGFELTPLEGLIFSSMDIKSTIIPNMDSTGMSVFMTIGILILLLASFNYMNIAISSAAKRLKEIGMRKTLGSTRYEIIKQFLSENFFLCFIASLIGAGLAQILFVPVLLTLSNTNLPHSIFQNNDIWLILLAVLLFTSVCGGAYPAFYISKFQPASIFRGNQKTKSKKLFTRSLIVFQYVITSLLITLSLIVLLNSRYQSRLDWGYNPKDIITVPLAAIQYNEYKTEIESNPNVIRTAGSFHHVGGQRMNQTVDYLGKIHEVKRVDIGLDYLELMEIRLHSGRFFERENSTDIDRSIVINEKFAAYMNWDDPIGEMIKIDGQEHSVIGMAKDFHSIDFMSPIRPILFKLSDAENYLIVKCRPGTETDTEEFIQKLWKDRSPNVPYAAYLQRHLLDDFIATEVKMAKLFGMYGIVALIISCMGLFSLISITIVNRMKEISIRKVLGANILSIYKDINMEFFYLLLIAALIGGPASFYLITAILDQINPYHMPITPGHISIVLSMILLAVIVTASSLIHKAVSVNPADTLRNE